MQEHPENILSPPRGLRWLYVDFNSYFASVEQQLDPRLRGRPVIVVPVETDSTCAIAASYEAKAFGIRTGTPVREAKRLCPGLACVPARHGNYRTFRDRLLDEIGRHVPVAAVCSIDEMACRLMRNEAAEEKAVGIARAIKAGIAQNVGEFVRCSIGIAPNRYLAKVATDLQKPDGLVVLRPEDLPHGISGLALRDLPGIGPGMERRLARAGIRDVPGLLRLSPRHLRAVWGSIGGEKMWYLLRGYDLPDGETRRGSVGHSHVLPPDMRPRARAADVARRLTLKAAARLRRMGYYAAVFCLSVRLERGGHIALEARCRPAQDTQAFLDLLHALWREIRREAGEARLRKVSVTLSGLVPAAELGAQGDLFAPCARESAALRKNERLSHAMDALNQRFGRDTVLLGLTPARGKTFSGASIAFTRIPDAEEFLE